MQNAASVPKNSLVCAQIYERFTNDGEWKVVNGECRHRLSGSMLPSS